MQSSPVSGSDEKPAATTGRAESLTKAFVNTAARTATLAASAILFGAAAEAADFPIVPATHTNLYAVKQAGGGTNYYIPTEEKRSYSFIHAQDSYQSVEFGASEGIVSGSRTTPLLRVTLGLDSDKALRLDKFIGRYILEFTGDSPTNSPAANLGFNLYFFDTVTAAAANNIPVGEHAPLIRQTAGSSALSFNSQTMQLVGVDDSMLRLGWAFDEDRSQWIINADLTGVTNKAALISESGNFLVGMNTYGNDTMGGAVITQPTVNTAPIAGLEGYIASNRGFWAQTIYENLLSTGDPIAHYTPYEYRGTVMQRVTIQTVAANEPVFITGVNLPDNAHLRLTFSPPITPAQTNAVLVYRCNDLAANIWLPVPITDQTSNTVTVATSGDMVFLKIGTAPTGP